MNHMWEGYVLFNIACTCGKRVLNILFTCKTMYMKLLLEELHFTIYYEGICKYENKKMNVYSK